MIPSNRSLNRKETVHYADEPASRHRHPYDGTMAADGLVSRLAKFGDRAPLDRFASASEQVDRSAEPNITFNVRRYHQHSR
jgi:hypothetical protein